MITGRVAVPAVVLCALLLIQCCGSRVVMGAPTTTSGLKQQPMKPMNAVEMDYYEDLIESVNEYYQKKNAAKKTTAGNRPRRHIHPIRRHHRH